MQILYSFNLLSSMLYFQFPVISIPCVPISLRTHAYMILVRQREISLISGQPKHIHIRIYFVFMFVRCVVNSFSSNISYQETCYSVRLQESNITSVIVFVILGCNEKISVH